jgi:predicted Zn finger-like uncharacterized protein
MNPSAQEISCPDCKTKMIVKFEALLGASAMTEAVVLCEQCKKEFSVRLPGRIVPE